MRLTQFLTPDDVRLEFRAEDKWDALRMLAAALGRDGRLPESLRGAAEAALFVRERSMTTGMENGIAIPHAALSELEEVIGVLAIAPDGIPFETLDGGPAHVLVCLLTPKTDKLLHIRTLAEIARLLSDKGIRERLRRAQTAAEVLDTIRGAE